MSKRQPGTFLAACLCAFLCARPSSAEPVPAPGYYVNTYAAGISTPTSVAFTTDGWLFVSRLSGEVMAFRDLNGNGVADTVVTVATGFEWPLCVTPHNGSLYVSSHRQVTRLTDLNGDHVADVADTLLADLPAGRHWTTAIAFGPDGNMYVGLGSEGNLSAGDPWQGTILRFTPEGDFIDIFATGLRNPYDIVFNHEGQLFATDNGAASDSNAWNCYEAPDELNWIRPGRDYGFPECFGTGDCVVQPTCDPQPCGAGDCQTGSGCDGSMTPPIALFDAHSSSDGMTFGGGFKGYNQFDLFVAQFGQSELIEGCPTSYGHRIVRVRTRKQGQTWKADPPVNFVTGLELPLDVAVGPDSALYVADYTGKILRVFRTSEAVGVEDGGPGGRPASALPPFRLSPNPAVRSSRLLWESPPPAGAECRLFDLSGRLVARLPVRSADGSPGPEWDLTDLRGRRVAPGLYFVQVSAGAGSRTERLVVVE